MKRTIALLALALTAAPFFADIYSPHRFVEGGGKLDLEAGQNLFGVSDLLVKDLVIDLPKIYDNMGSGGFYLNLGETANLFFNVNINGYGAGINVSESLSSTMNISKDFFKLLAYGNDLDREVSTSMSVNLESFINISAPIYLRISKFKITATPSFFVPVLYLPNPAAKLTYTTNSDGKVTAKGHADFSLYSLIDLSRGIKYTESDGQTNTTFDFSFLTNSSDLPQELLAACSGCGGVDLGIQIEFPWSSKLDFGAYANIPIFHGLLKHSLSGSADFSMDMDGFMNHYTSQDSSGDAYTLDYKMSNLETNSSQYYVNRPLRAGVELAFRPLGNWFTLHPKIGVAMRNPFGEDFTIDSIYPEYSLSADLSLFKVLEASVCTQYTDRVFIHTLGLTLNARIMELNFLVGTSGGDFLKSFNLGGLKASVGLSVGF